MDHIRTPSLKRSTLFSVVGAIVYGISLVLMDVAIAQRYGTSTQAAIYQAAYMIPTLLIGMLSGGAILGAFVPIFIRLGGQRHQPDADRFLRSIVGLLLTVLIPLTVLLVGIAPLIATTIASGFDLTAREELINVLRLMVPMLIPHGVAYIYYSALVSTGRVGLPNILPLLIPLTGMVTHPWWGAHNGAEMIAIGYLIGAMLLTITTGWRLRLDGFRVTPTRPAGSPEWKTFFQSYLMTAIALAGLSALLLVNQAVAGSLSARHLAAFSYGAKLVLLAQAFFTTIVNSVALPHFSSMTLRIGRKEIWSHISRFTLWAFLLAGLGTLVWAILAGWIVDVVYARGEFNNVDTALVANVQRAFVLQIPFYVIGIFCWRMLNALSQWKPLIMATLPALVMDIGLVSRLALEYGAAGIAMAHSLSIAAWALILLIALRQSLLSQSG